MKVVIFFDGGTRVHNGIAAGGAVVYDEAGVELAARGRFLDNVTTNNVAEYQGLILGLETALELGATEARVFGDSEVIVRHVDGRYKCRKPHLQPLLKKVWELGRHFDRVRIEETPAGKKGKRRDNNVRADELCGMTMDQRADVN
jgi:ribonuclease HI